MPCNSDYMLPTRQEMDAKHHEEQVKIKAELDRLTHENDELREMVLRQHGGGKVTASELRLVNARQVKHRKEDLTRLERTLRELILTAQAGGASWVETLNGKQLELRCVYERLGRVMTADTAHPLEPQLGFDPDSI